MPGDVGPTRCGWSGLTQSVDEPLPPAARSSRCAESSSLWVQVVVLYLGLRVVSALLLARAAQEQVWFPAVTGPSAGDIDLAVSWDAKWYERIAAGGYPDELPVGEDGRVQQNPWAFTRSTR